MTSKSFNFENWCEDRDFPGIVWNYEFESLELVGCMVWSFSNKHEIWNTTFKTEFENSNFDGRNQFGLVHTHEFGTIIYNGNGTANGTENVMLLSSDDSFAKYLQGLASWWG